MKIVVSPGPTFSSNPFFNLLNEEMRKKGHGIFAPRLQTMLHADIFHVNFPEHFVSERKNLFAAAISAAAMLTLMLIHKMRGKKLVWTVHDVLPLRNRYPALCETYMRAVKSMVDLFVFLSDTSRAVFVEQNPLLRAKSMITLFHPGFPTEVLTAQERAAARERLGVAPDEFVVGFLGDIKPYKNIEFLDNIPDTLPDGRPVKLLVAGKADKTDINAFEAALEKRGTLRINRRIDDAELMVLIQAVDLAALPYRWGWNSGLLMLVLSCEQRCLVSALPIFKELEPIIGRSWIKTIDINAPEIRQMTPGVLGNIASQSVHAPEPLQALRTYLDAHTFEKLADKLLGLYQA